MAGSTLIIDSVPPEQRGLMFPTLAPDEVARVAIHGRTRSFRQGEVLIQSGDTVVPFFVVKSGRLHVVRTGASGEQLVVVHSPGSFTGESNMLLGRPALMRVEAADDGEAVELTREQMLTMVQNDTDIGDI